MLALLLPISVAWLGPAPRALCDVRRRHATPLAAIEPTNACAEAQRTAYFELMPSENLPKVSLDLRAWLPRNDDAEQAAVLARQQGTVSKWRNVGYVAAQDVASLAAAVSKQRTLITAWAHQACDTYDPITGINSLLLDMSACAPPIELAYTPRPKKSGLFQPKAADAGSVTPVPAQTPYDESLRCGFLGQTTRTIYVPSAKKSTQGAPRRYERIELPQ